ncbi:MAG: HEAT repeat domain-containing protein [Anaerolineae bacterium]|nr:HEAT repeat domain-containing protein [Anaerolineae bacterium]
MEDNAATTQLRQLLMTYFTLAELHELCFDMGFDFENLPNIYGEKPKNVIALIKILHGQNRLPEFVELCRQKRPRVDWPAAPTRLYFEEDIQAEAKLQDALDEYKKYIRGKWGRDSLLDRPLADFYIPLQGQGPAEKKLKEDNSASEKGQDSSPESTLENSKVSIQDQKNHDKKEPQFVLQYPLPLDLQEALKKHERLIVLGTAGTGKSTFLRHLVHQKTSNNDSAVPIWVSLADFAKVIENPQPGAKTRLKQWAIETAHEDPTIQAILNRAVEENQVLWLLDGFDETGNQMNKVADAIAQLPSKNQLVLTTRPDTLLGYQHRFNATQYELRDLSQHDVQQFLQKWFDDQDKTSDVLKWLTDADHPQRRELITKPLHLVLLATIAKETSRNDFPETRVQLYGKFKDIFLDKRIKKKRDGNGFFQLGTLKRDEARAAAIKGFHCLGWVLFHQEKELSTNGITIDKQVIDCLKQAEYSNEDAEAILSFWQEAGVQKSFHQMLWPYAVACKLHDDWQKDAENTWQFLSSATRELPYASRLHHPAWQEPILMLAALMAEQKQRSEDNNQLDNLIGHLLGKGDKEERYLHQNLRLAAAILGEVGPGKLTKKYELKIVKQLGQLAGDYSKEQSITFYATSVGLFILGLLVSYQYLSLLPFWVVATFWTVFWFVWWRSISLPGILGRSSLVISTLVMRANTLFMRFLGLSSPNRKIFIEALSSADVSAIPQLERTIFELLPDSKLRYEVLKVLGNIGSKEAVPFLSRIMNEGRGVIRLAAADALGKIDQETATQALIRGIEYSEYIALRGEINWYKANSPFIVSSTAVSPLIDASKNSRESSVRRLAAITLGEIGDKRAIPPLIAALDDNSDFVSEPAANALVKIGIDAIPDLHAALNKESVSNPTRYRIALILVDLGDFRAIHHLMPYLKNSDGDVVRNTIRKVLVQIGKVRGKKAVYQYLQICKLNPYDRTTTIAFQNALEELDLPGAVFELIDLSSSSLQYFLLEALGDLKISLVEIENDLIRAANNDAWKGKWQSVQIIKILGEIGSVDAIPNLLDILSKNQGIFAGIAQNPADYENIRVLIKGLNYWAVEKAAIEALGKIKAGVAVPALTHILTFDDKKIVAAITTAFKQEDVRETITTSIYFANLPDLRATAAIALREIGSTAPLDSIFHVLARNDNAGHIDAVHALGTIGDVKAIPHLIKILTTANGNFPWEEANLYKATATALGQIGNARAIPPLIDLLRNSYDSGIRDEAVKALKQIDIDSADKETISNLIEALGDWREQIHQTASEILVGMGGSVVKLLCDALRNSDDQQVRYQIMQILGEIGDGNAIPLLIEALESSDKSVGRAAVQALAKIGSIEEDDFEKLVEAFNDRQKSYLHAETAVTLGQLAGSISDKNALQSARKALWQRRFAHYKENVFLAYEKVVTSLIIAQVRQLSPNDINLSSGSPTKTIFLSHLRDTKWLLLLFGALLLVAIETFSGLFAEILRPYLPSGIAGLAILLVIIVLLIASQSHFHDSASK